MRILVFGSTGYVGGVVTDRVLAHGHEAVAVVRSTAKLDNLRRARPGVEVRVGDLAEPASLTRLVTDDIDAVIQAAAVGEWAVERTAAEVLTDALARTTTPKTDRAFVYVSGTWVLGGGDHPLDEESPVKPIDLVADRPSVEETTRRAKGVRGIVVRAGVVHGHDGGIPAMVGSWAREDGVGRYVVPDRAGEHDAHAYALGWPMVHVDDLADLLVLAARTAPSGAVLHGVSEPHVPVVEVAQALADTAGAAGDVQPWPVTEAASVLGRPFAEALALSQTVEAPASYALGWAPGRPQALDDLSGDEPAHPRRPPGASRPASRH